MQRIDTLKGKEAAEIEELFSSRALEALEKIELPAFRADGLSLARSEKEIAKCVAIAEKAEHKKELKRQDAERASAAKEDLTNAGRRAKNMKRKPSRSQPDRRSKSFPSSKKNAKATAKPGRKTRR